MTWNGDWIMAHVRTRTDVSGSKIPVYQLSLDYTKPPEYHYALSKELSALRRKGVLIIGSGNIVHNLGMIQWSDKAFDWAIEFDAIAANHIEKNHQPLINYKISEKLRHFLFHPMNIIYPCCMLSLCRKRMSQFFCQQNYYGFNIYEEYKNRVKVSRWLLHFGLTEQSLLLKWDWCNF